MQRHNSRAFICVTYNTKDKAIQPYDANGWQYTFNRYGKYGCLYKGDYCYCNSICSMYRCKHSDYQQEAAVNSEISINDISFSPEYLRYNGEISFVNGISPVTIVHSSD